VSNQEITSQFWIAKFDSKDRFSEFFAEDDEYFSEENEERDDYPLSQFLASQDETWCDHDFLEVGFNSDEAESVSQRFAGHSWVEEWAPMLEEKIKKLEVLDYNAFAMMGVEQTPDRPPNYQVSEPHSFTAEGIQLIYLGEITHKK